jgi:prepilin-type processing-associated H-X9-DG protein
VCALDGRPLVRNGQAAVIFDASNPSDWRSIEAEEALFCAGNTVDPNGNIFFAGGHVAMNSTDSVNNLVHN